MMGSAEKTKILNQTNEQTGINGSLNIRLFRLINHLK